MHALTLSVLGISGSIRPSASSTLILKWLGERLSVNHTFHLFEAMASIPPFDGTEPVPAPIEALIAAIRASDFIVFCSPEYAHGISGVLKNALDWTVASDVWINKPVAVITAAGQGEHAHASLIEILSTMSATVVREASVLIGFVKAKIDRDGNITDNATAAMLDRLAETIVTFKSE